MSRFASLLHSAALLAVAFAAPAAVRAQSVPPKVFYACYVPSSGTTYRIKEADLRQECSKSTHVPFSWTDGTSKPVFSEIRHSQGPFIEVAPNGEEYAYAPCPEGGYKAIAGSYFIASPSNQVTIRFAAPNGPSTGWVVRAANTDPSAVLKIAAVVTCVR